MKFYYFLTILILFPGCFLLSNEKLIIKKKLVNDLSTGLYSSNGGATAPDVVWVKKLKQNSDDIIIGKINGFTTKGFKIDINKIDSSHISIKFTDTVIFIGRSRTFIIDLNNKIERNDGSPFNQ